MKILHIDTGMSLRGGQHQLLHLAQGLARRYHEQLIVCPEESPLEGRARAAGFGVFSLPAHDPGHAFGTLLLRQELRAQRFDIVHAHDGRGQTIAWLASLGVPVRRVASRRVAFLPPSKSTHRLKYGGSCDAIIAVSDHIRQSLVGAGIEEAKIELIPDGVEIPSDLPDSAARKRIRDRWGYGDNEFLVGHVGAFTHEKGQDVAIEAAARLASKLPQLRLLLAGDGPLRPLAQIQAQTRGVQDRVLLPGYLENLSPFLDSLDLFIMPSRAEGLGSAALHAMARGLAVVASRVGGLAEIVDEGRTGWLVPPDAPTALADAIAAAADDRACLARFGTNARDRVRQFSSDIFLERTESLYRRLAGL